MSTVKCKITETYPSLVDQMVKNPPIMWDTWVQHQGWEDPLEKVTATHSSILAWVIPWTEKLQSMGSQRVGYDWADWVTLGFSGSSAGKESACNAGYPSLIPGSGRSPGEGIGYPLQYSWASLVAQMVKIPPTLGKTWFRFLGWEDPLEEGMAIHSSILTWRIPMDRAVWWGTVHTVAKSQTWLSD